MEQGWFTNTAVKMEFGRVYQALGLNVSEMLNRILELDHQQKIHIVGN